jgi:hypothetical protein
MLATSPLATGSAEAPFITTGILRLASRAAATLVSVGVTMTSTLSATNSAASSCHRSLLPPNAVLNSINTFWPTM